jgi:uncharacterized protein with PhoU and TrkA domain
MLIELKNLTEVMIDLAYSAVIFNNRDIAEEVRRMEERVDDLWLKFDLHVLSLMTGSKKKSEFLSLLRIGIASESIADAAYQIAETVLKGTPHPIFPTIETETEETITMVKVIRNSPFIKKTLEELDLSGRYGHRVIAINRKGKWVYCPRKDIMVESGDILITRGYAAGRKIVEDLAAAKVREFPASS